MLFSAALFYALNSMTNTTAKLPKVPEKALEALKNGIQSILDNKDWSGFLQAIRQIHDYSFNNRFLIMFEQAKRGWNISPLVAGKTKWDMKFNRKIKREEWKNPIWIMAPVMVNKKDENGDTIRNADGKAVQIPVRFRGVRVYDHRQTEGDPLPSPDISGMMDQLESDISPDVLCALFGVAQSRSIEVLDQVPLDEMGGALGRCWFQNEGRASKIELRADLNLATKISVIAHELGHAILHNRDEYLEHDSTSIKELEAESVAYLVCSHYNLDLKDRSFKYIVHHNVASDDVVADLLRSGERIFRAYEEITKYVDQILLVETKEVELKF